MYLMLLIKYMKYFLKYSQCNLKLSKLFIKRFKIFLQSFLFNFILPYKAELYTQNLFSIKNIASKFLKKSRKCLYELDIENVYLNKKN